MHRTPVPVHERRIRELLAPLGTRPAERVPVGEALGRRLAVAVSTPIPLPPFRNSQMDGFAVRAAEVAAAPVALPIAGEVAAAPGAPPPLAPGTAVRIMTGAPVPDGADAVVPVEDTAVADGVVTIARSRAAGEFVREPGSDLAEGGELLPVGIRLAPRHLAALAAAGLDEVAVDAPVRVAVISTGSELVAPGEPLAPGAIPDSNGVAIAAAVAEVGARVVLEGRVRDDPAAFGSLLDAAIEAGAELVLTSGGISQGAYEVVREVLEPVGAVVDVLAMQPGGPQASGRWREVPVVCFPGNPVSSQLSFLLFVAPVLREIAGLPAVRRESRTLDVEVASAPGRRQFLRGRRLPDGRVTTVAGPSSHLVAALAAADVVLDIPEHVTSLPVGATVETWEL